MFLHSGILIALSAISYAAMTLALAPGPEVLTAPPFQPTAAPAPAPQLSFTLSCWCETIPYLTTTFCLPCSTVYFTNQITAPVATATA
ncbi:hypothetical protein DFH09DRAFT_1324382 [Mycena vulgaris]|nr:hypothetical protein DFH09DRAFT_1324382 [Mycena vulgaris]